MLAEAMVRLSRGKPDRKYAADPELLAGLQNYMRLFLRGQDVPRQHYDSRQVIQPHYAKNPVLHQAWQSLQGDQPDPSDLAAYLDMLEEHAGINENYSRSGWPHTGLTHMLPALHDLLYNVQRHPQIAGLRGQQYGNRILTAQPVRNRVMEHAYDEFPGAEGSVGGVLTDILGGRWPRSQLGIHQQGVDLLSKLDEGDATAFPAVYDYGLHLADNDEVPSRTRNSGLGLTNRTQTAIQRGVMPLLEGPAFSHLRGA